MLLQYVFMLVAVCITIFNHVGCWFYSNMYSCWLLVLVSSQYLIMLLIVVIAIFNHVRCWCYRNM